MFQNCEMIRYFIFFIDIFLFVLKKMSYFSDFDELIIDFDVLMLLFILYIFILLLLTPFIVIKWFRFIIEAFIFDLLGFCFIQ